MPNIIHVSGLSKQYGRRLGIEKVNLEVASGQIYGFLGPNGAGKTTTIRLLLGLVRATNGQASVFGLDAWNDSARIKRDVGYLPADLRLYSWMSAAAALAVFGRIRGMDLMQYGRQLAERFQLEWNLNVRRMSRGMRQKLGLILAIVHQPKLLILDEPTSGLDPLMQEQLARTLREFAERGHTVFFSSHTLSEVEQLCDRVAIVRKGRTVADETLDALRNRASRSVVLVFRDLQAATETSPPDFLKVNSRSNVVWKCELAGSAQPLVQWAAQQPLSDLEVGRPDLETVFRSYYPAAETDS